MKTNNYPLMKMIRTLKQLLFISPLFSLLFHAKKWIRILQMLTLLQLQEIFLIHQKVLTILRKES